MKFLWIRNQMRKKPRIYIMPTKMGGYLNGLIFLMFLLAVGYSNNLLLIFTLFLFTLNLMWVIQTHFHLHALKPGEISIHDGHAGERTPVTIKWKSLPEGPHQWEMNLENEAEIFSLTDSQEILIHERGVRDFKFLKVSSSRPFGLYHSWIYFPVNVRAWTYPAKLRSAPGMEKTFRQDEGEFSGNRTGPHDVWNLAPYANEESRRISWKHYARTGELVVKEGQEPSKSMVTFHAASAPDSKEYHLSKLATQMLECARTNTSFILEVPGKKPFSGDGQKHLSDCLRELTKC